MNQPLFPPESFNPAGSSQTASSQKKFARKLKRAKTAIPDTDGNIALWKRHQTVKAIKEDSSFNYVSSHDLQEPLRKILTFSSRILEKEQPNLSDNGIDCIERMQEAARRMQHLIADLNEYSRLTASEKVFQKTNLNVLFEQVIHQFEDRIKEKNALINSNDLGEGNVIPFQFKQLLHNILSNSLKFAHQEKEPVISVKKEILQPEQLQAKNIKLKKACLHINISDNGIGFEPKFSKKIFGVFQRLNSRDKYEGTGIGLAICKRIIENHKGVIRASGQANCGASFDIYIPAESPE